MCSVEIHTLVRAFLAGYVRRVLFQLDRSRPVGFRLRVCNFAHLFEAVHELVRLPIAGSKSLAIVAFLEMVTP